MELEIIEKSLILTFDADKEDVKNGKFGFDKFINICTSDFTKLEEEYKPLTIYKQKYYPVWVSMRIGQTITLKLDFLDKKNYKFFKEIKFESNPDFTFEPTNLKDAKKIKITCHNNSSEPLQLKIEGDGETVGAINFFYPEPKTLALDWRFVEVTGNNSDRDKLNYIVKVEKLKALLKKGFNPLLIDLKIV
ncbi:hypothetical protein HNQ02_003715 [Flavobacterium sp. 7E]|uniref:hypothetical protein n=1 Tax=unclassified Flavobacterium TaxID=196869 RepID=UPI00156DFE6E|nr:MULTISPECIES: hypothetical protein [unclassified Flavobacterium]MBE0393654.1 hypothetical protein [Flavobacterium sp. PL002]NRS90768.1 hypothetical protein [Flavobacterium sp. 7E]